MSPSHRAQSVVLLAEDGEHDVQAIQRAWRMLGLEPPLQIVRDGTECMDYIRRRGQYADPAVYTTAGLLILDLRMPKMDGLAVLREIKSLPGLKRLPIVVFTSSCNEEDIARCYDSGANAYIAKPSGASELMDVLKAIHRFWQRIVPPDLTEDESANASKPAEIGPHPAR